MQLGYLQQQQFVERSVQDALVAIRQEQAARDREAAEAIVRAEAAEAALREQSKLGSQQLEVWRSRAEDAERWRNETEASFNEFV